MEQNTNETIEGEFTEEEGTPIKKRFVITPKLKKALAISGVVVGIIATAAVVVNRKAIEKHVEDDSVEIQMVTNPDGTETLTISEVHTTSDTNE